MRDATRILQALVTPAEPGSPLHEGPVFAAPFHVPGEVADSRYSYARYQQPTWTALERVLSLIETGDGLDAASAHADRPGQSGRTVKALCFGSGMAAIMAVMATVLRAGDAVVLPEAGYFTTRVLAEGFFREHGVEVRLARASGAVEAEMLRGARLLWLESPSNPGMQVVDIRELADQAHAAGALVACDNTTATPLGQNVLALGADFSVVSDTKLMTGHSDLLLGHVAVTDAAWYEKLLGWRNLAGSGPGPMEAWLALRSLATLPLRLDRSTSNALAVARWLEGRSDVAAVHYPGLPSHPAHAIAASQMQSFGPVVSFELRSRAAAEAFLSTARLVTNATSFGGIATTAERRARWGHDEIPEGFLRMSVGCEAIEDLLEDLAQALDAAGDVATEAGW